jgi:hypothetical protein
MFSILDRIKINEELCPTDKRTEKRFQFGKLNYFAVMLEWEFEVIKTFDNPTHGAMVECKVLNDPENRSNIALRAEDCILVANTNLEKMSYEVISLVNKNQGLITELSNKERDLFTVRKERKQRGIKASDASMVQNWSEIKDIRLQIKKVLGDSDTQYTVRHSSGVYTFSSKEDKVALNLSKLISAKRRELKKITPTIKVVAGNLTYQKVGGVLIKPAEFSRLNENFAQNIIQLDKVPTTMDNYVGIEIEMLSPKTVSEMEKLMIKARLHKYVNIGDDASIRTDTDGFNRMELRVCLPENLLESHLKILCDVLRKNDCYANRSCGMHVHVDMRNRDPELCYRNFFKVQDVMLEAQPMSRRKNKYCMPSTEKELKLSEFDDTDRRSAINTNSYNKNNMRTIEIRIHEGATKYRDIINWVKFLVGTASLKTDLPKVVTTVSELRSMDYLTESVLSHLEERIEEYSA